MIRNTIFFLGLLSLLIGNGCERTEENVCAARSSEKPFFDIRTFICERINDYETAGTQVDKAVSLNGNEETKKALSIDWLSELRPFIESDINRSAWFDAFQIDTTAVDGSTIIRYRSEDKRIPVRKLTVQWSREGNVEAIDVISRRKNVLYTSEQTLNFQPDVSYSVKGWQRTLFLSKTEFEVNAQLLQ